jgi:hypothetical protein
MLNIFPGMTAGKPEETTLPTSVGQMASETPYPGFTTMKGEKTSPEVTP